MFGKRHDGVLVSHIGPLEKIVPYIMKQRIDALNHYKEEFDCAYLDKYIAEKKEQGINYSYMHIVIAAMVRVLALRPRLNRFVKNGKIYARNNICVSIAIQRSLRVEEAETTLKFVFDGTETLEDVRKQIDETIEKTMNEQENDTDKMADLIMHMPGFVIKLFLGFMNFLDNHELMPKFAFDVSPFHTSMFITNLKSLGINYLYHHCYEFGTTGIFIAMGKEKKNVVPSKKNEGEIDIKKTLTLGIVIDERFCDGLYCARSMKYLHKFMKDPSILETPLEKRVEDDQL